MKGSGEGVKLTTRTLERLLILIRGKMCWLDDGWWIGRGRLP
jgi:hypothetical protein